MPTNDERWVALACLDYLHGDAEELVEAAAAAGFDAVTLRVTGSAEPVPGDVGSSVQRRRRVTEALARTGLGVLDVEVVRLAPELEEVERARAVKLAAALGARHLLVVNTSLEEQAAVRQLASIVELAEGSGVRPCLEFMAFSHCRTLQEAVATAVPAGAGVLIDALHLHRSGGTVADVADAVRRHGPELFPYLQLCDAPAAIPSGAAALREEAVTRRLLPGEGQLNLAGLLDLLPAAAVAVEAPTLRLASEPAHVRAKAAAAAVDATLGRPPRR